MKSIRFLSFVCLLIAVLGFRLPVTPVRRRTTNALRMDAEYDNLLNNIKSHTPPGTLVVIKYGGHAMENEELKKFFCEDVAALCRIGIIPVIVHGGGPQIKAMLENLKIESKFLQGLRVTDKKTMDVAQMVLCGAVNKEIVGLISSHAGIRGAIGLSGLDGQLIKAKKIQKKGKDESGKEVVLDLGLVGDTTAVNTQMIKDFINLKLVPVIAPVAANEVDGTSLNLNADTAAGTIAEFLKADRLLLLTDITGVLDKEKKLIDKLPTSSFQGLIDDGTISGGMIPKLENAISAAKAGVKTVNIMDGRVRHCILKALSGEVFGTRVVQG